jgi:hypothetical protein
MLSSTAFWSLEFREQTYKFVENSFFLEAQILLQKVALTSALTEAFYAHIKANKMPSPMSYYTSILSTAMCSKSSNLTFDLVFLKIQYLIFLKNKRHCIHVTIIITSANIMLGLQWDQDL